MAWTYEASVSTQGARVHTLENQVLGAVDGGNAFLSGRTPGKKDDAFGPLGSHSVDDFLGEPLPPLAGMRVCLVGTHGQAGVQQKHAAVSPGGEKATVSWGWLEGWVVLF